MSIKERNKLHNSRLKQVEDYIKNGGRITKVETGVILNKFCTEPKHKKMNFSLSRGKK